MSQQGFIKLHRKIQQHWIYDEKRKFSKYEAWLDMLMMASHKDNKFVLGNELIEIKRGQFITSIRKLGERWDWSNTKVTQFLDLLKSDEMIDFKKDTKKTLITVGNYGVYHDYETEEKTQNEHEKDTNRTQKHTIKNVKECIKNDNNKNKTSTSKKLKFSDDDMTIVDFFISEIRKNNENFKEPNKNSWANDIRMMVEIDGRDRGDICKVIRYVQNDSFWQSNCLSTKKLREKFDSLIMKVKSNNTSGGVSKNEIDPTAGF